MPTINMKYTDWTKEKPGTHGITRGITKVTYVGYFASRAVFGSLDELSLLQRHTSGQCFNGVDSPDDVLLWEYTPKQYRPCGHNDFPPGTVVRGKDWVTGTYTALQYVTTAGIYTAGPNFVNLTCSFESMMPGEKERSLAEIT